MVVEPFGHHASPHRLGTESPRELPLVMVNFDASDLPDSLVGATALDLVAGHQAVNEVLKGVLR